MLSVEKSRTLRISTKIKKYKDGREYHCKICTSARMKKQYNDNLETKRAASLISYHKNKNLEKIKARNIKRRYGLEVKEYEDLLANGCAICKTTENLCIDHDHNCCPGKETCGECIRGVLCWNHNLGEAKFKSVQEIESLLEYRNKYEQTNLQQ